MHAKGTHALARRLTDFCRVRIDKSFPPVQARRLSDYILSLAAAREPPPMIGQSFDWKSISKACGVEQVSLSQEAGALRPAFLALSKAFRVQRVASTTTPYNSITGRAELTSLETDTSPAKRGPKPKPIVEFPRASDDVWIDPPGFAEALSLHLKRHDDSDRGLLRAILLPGEVFDRTTIRSWRRGERQPQSSAAMAMLRRIERRYGLGSGYFKAKLAHPGRANLGHPIPGIKPSERRRIAWHLPDDFETRSVAEQEDILSWVRRVIVSGSTDYRRYQATAVKTRFALRFPGVALRQPPVKPRPRRPEDQDAANVADADPLLSPGTTLAPELLLNEMRALVRFKTDTLTAIGYQRGGVWGEETASQKVEHLGLLFGALAAPAAGAVCGHEAPISDLAMGHLVFPALWDWYVQWRERRRGFYTAWEVDMLSVASALTREATGWIRQTPQLADRLKPIEGLVSQADIKAARLDWKGACERQHRHAIARAKEIKRVARP